jgi:putative GTP pyrophosphokinase
VTLDPEELRASFADRGARYKRATETIKGILRAHLEDLSRQYGVREEPLVIGEPKTFDSFLRKATTKYQCETIDEAYALVRDLARVRVVCPTLSDVRALVRMLEEQESLFVDETSIKDQSTQPSVTGYRAIHLEVSVNVSVDGASIAVPVEVQIRTALQEAWGGFTHAEFYRAEEVPEFMAALMRELSDLLHWSDKHADAVVKRLAELREEGTAATGD